MKRKEFGAVLVNLLHWLYEADVLEEDAILAWHEQMDEKSASELRPKACRYRSICVFWQYEYLRFCAFRLRVLYSGWRKRNRKKTATELIPTEKNSYGASVRNIY